ncbi:putative oxidoreductase protein [Caenispirillum salinarum AK4]|uniref:Putative oxidoreductase protein n=1 Tax=Caenispirillum salinarum AK4 TaxID=1238182 RepID=K9H4B9_9PROT|nr:aldo/keto reductase [Caenispirillum salinarum]EKV32422.1 putative oxidoreductase protein [Caenispirillum salinarum AK4]
MPASPLTVRPTRRAVLAGLAAGGAALALPPGLARAQQNPARTKAVPSTGQAIPVIGMGTWITFNVGQDPKLRSERTEVLRAFFAHGGGVIDSSPMYGSSQAVVGHGLDELGHPPGLIAADKVWTSDGDDGPGQIRESLRDWGIPRFNLLQVHNLRAWRPHLETLFAMKEAGELAHVGITTSHGRRHGEMEAVMRDHPIDFVQLTYNAVDREAEARLLPLAQEKGIAVIANRPFRRSALVDRVQRHPLPAFAAEAGCETWPALLLKYIVSHPAVTCAIPATTQVVHMRENMAAARGPVLDEALRRRIADVVAAL